jgi:hypothetical protein
MREPPARCILANSAMHVQVPRGTHKAQQAMKEWVAFALFLAATAILATVPLDGLPWWFCVASSVPFYIWAIVTMTAADELKL